MAARGERPSSARKVVAWPLPQDEDRLRPRTTSFMPPPAARSAMRLEAARRPARRAAHRCARPARGASAACADRAAPAPASAPRDDRPRPARRARPAPPRRASRNCSIPSHASVIRQAAAPAASNTRVAGEKPTCAMLSRATLSTALRRAVEGVVLGRVDMARSRGRWPASPCRPSRCRRAGTAARAAARRARGRTPPPAPRDRAGGCRGRRDRGEAVDRAAPGWCVVGIERVVDRHALAPRRSRDRRRSPAGRRHRSAPCRDRAARAAPDARDRRASRRAWRRRRHPRRCAAHRRRAPRDDAFEQLAVEHADAVRLDDDVGRARFRQHRRAAPSSVAG